MVQIILFTCKMNFQPNNQDSEGKNHMAYSFLSLKLGKPSASTAKYQNAAAVINSHERASFTPHWFNFFVTLMAKPEETHSVSSNPSAPNLYFL